MTRPVPYTPDDTAWAHRFRDFEAVRAALLEHPWPWCNAVPLDYKLRVEDPALLACFLRKHHGTREQHENALGERWGAVEREIDRVPERVKPRW